MSKGKNKIYAYCILDKKDIIVEKGILYTWNECQNIVKGKKSRYKSFQTEKEAYEWLESGAQYADKEKKQILIGKLYEELDRNAIYFDAGTGRGKGVEVRLTDFNGNSLLHKVLENSKLNEFGNYYLSKGRTNNFGELVGFFAAIKYALKFGVNTICGDSSLVIEYWSKGRFNRVCAVHQFLGCEGLISRT